MTRPEGERIAVLEAQVKALSEQIDGMQATLQEVRDAVIQAKAGGRVALGAAALCGGFLAWMGQTALNVFLKSKGG